jgi:hypothetical protein
MFPKYLGERHVKMNNNGEREGKEFHVMTLKVLGINKYFVHLFSHLAFMR